MRRILYTRQDGGVSVCEPSIECLTGLQRGGYWGVVGRGFLDAQIARQEADGIATDVAHRFAHGLAFGGLTSAEAWAVIRDRDCRHGVAHEMVTIDALPDRWFRNAWRRSHNGGPVRIDLEAARDIQWGYVRAGIDRATAAAKADWRRLRESQPDLAKLAGEIERADDIDDLRRVGAEWHGKH